MAWKKKKKQQVKREASCQEIYVEGQNKEILEGNHPTQEGNQLSWREILLSLQGNQCFLGLIIANFSWFLPVRMFPVT